MAQWLTTKSFSEACAALPLISIDLMVTRSGRAGPELLLGLRNNRPAMGWWFTPGGRIRKNEPLYDAQCRVAKDEIGLESAFRERCTLIGVFDHFYPDSAFDSATSTHYVNLPYLLPLNHDEATSLKLPSGINAQHANWKWLSFSEATLDPLVHKNVKITLEAASKLLGTPSSPNQGTSIRTRCAINDHSQN